MTTFIAHPSVRIKGSEHAYSPLLCQEDECPGRDKGAHMHCPLCTVTEAYQDPVILRAHFRIKHVDKGIDFSGLKVLRCCNHCEIVGTIKGEKRFKGAHWHCYRCRNGFNRRDETVKHFKTHFRNPHTTFQIQITQEVNCRQYYDGPEAHPKAYSGPAVCSDLEVEGGALTAVLTQQPALDDTLHTVEPKVSYSDSCTHDSFLVTSEEDADPSHHLDKTQTLVLMDADGQAGSLIYEEEENAMSEQDGSGLEQTALLERQVLELQQLNEALQLEKHLVERRLQAEIHRLQEQVSSMVQSNLKLSEELKLYRSVEPCNKRVKQLVRSLEEEHRTLLQTQLASLSRELLYQAGAVPLNGHVGAEEPTVSPDKVAARKGPDDIKVEVRSLAPEALEDAEAGREELDPGRDYSEVVQSTAVPLLVHESALSSRKRRPGDEAGHDERTKLQRRL